MKPYSANPNLTEPRWLRVLLTAVGGRMSNSYLSVGWGREPLPFSTAREAHLKHRPQFFSQVVSPGTGQGA